MHQRLRTSAAVAGDSEHVNVEPNADENDEVEEEEEDDDERTAVAAAGCVQLDEESEEQYEILFKMDDDTELEVMDEVHDSNEEYLADE